MAGGLKASGDLALHFHHALTERAHEGVRQADRGFIGTIQLLDQPQQVTAIVAGNDMIALDVLEAARRRGIDVPRQLSVIGFDDMPLAGSPLVSLTSIQLPVRAMARMAAHRLVERIRGRGGLPVREVLPIQVVKREITGPR